MRRAFTVLVLVLAVAAWGADRPTPHAPAAPDLRALEVGREVSASRGSALDLDGGGAIALEPDTRLVTQEDPRDHATDAGTYRYPDPMTRLRDVRVEIASGPNRGTAGLVPRYRLRAVGR